LTRLLAGGAPHDAELLGTWPVLQTAALELD